MRMHMTATVFVLEPVARPRLLLVRHDRGSLAGLWLPPGGHVEENERPEAAAVREVREETGLLVRLRDAAPAGYPSRLPGGVVRAVQPHHVQIEPIRGVAEGDHLHLDFIFVADAPAGAPPPAGEARRHARWFTEDEIQLQPVVADVRIWARRILEEEMGRGGDGQPGPAGA